MIVDLRASYRVLELIGTRTTKVMFSLRAITGLLLFSLLEIVESVPVQDASNSTAPVFEPAWVPGPTKRGTLAILFSCILTLVLCVWTTIHANIEPEIWQAGGGRLNQKKLMWSVVTLLFPEIALCVAAHERKTAHLLRKEMRIFIKYYHWDLTLAYYAVMGGFVITQEADSAAEREKVDYEENSDAIESVQSQEPEGSTTTSYRNSHTPHLTRAPKLQRSSFGSRCTLTPRGVLRLAELGKLPDSYTSRTVEDKSKASFLAKFVVCFQALWIIIQVGGRYATNLPVTLLELYTVLHTICAVAMYIIWIDKPFDVNQPTFVPIHPREMSELMKTDSTYHNPTSIFWHHDYAECLTKRAGLGKLLFRQLWDWNDFKQVETTFDNLRLLLGAYTAMWNGWRRFGWEAVALSLVGLAYGGLHLAAWNYTFPSLVERRLWKISSLLTAGAFTIFSFTVMIGFLGNVVWERVNKKMISSERQAQELAMRTTAPGTGEHLESAKKWGRFTQWLEKSRQSLIFGAMVCFCIGFVLAIIPCILARLYLLIESFVAMRKLPEGSYNVVSWGGFMPHFG